LILGYFLTQILIIYKRMKKFSYKRNLSIFKQSKKTNFINDIEVLASNKHFANNLWSVYAEGYKESANLICEHIINKQVLKKYAMIYPIIYLYRHYLELQFKNIIFLTNKALFLLEILVDSEQNENKKFINHNLLDLYEIMISKLKRLAKEIEETDAINEKEDFLNLKLIIKEFEKYDKFSQSFRYPEDKKGNINLQTINNINIENIYDVINRGTEVFDGVESWLNEKIDSIKEYLNLLSE